MFISFVLDKFILSTSNQIALISHYIGLFSQNGIQCYLEIFYQQSERFSDAKWWLSLTLKMSFAVTHW